MRLLIVTQKVDEADPVLGFFVDWLQAFSTSVDSVEVICLEQGQANLPENVQVHSLGKERGIRPSYIYALRFLGLVWRLRNSYDAVFVHMNPEYIVLAGWLWRILKKRVVLWYLHKSVTWKLRVALLFAQAILTATPESLRLESTKKRIVGHGINTETLLPLPSPATQSPIHLLTIGRLSPIKRVEFLIDAVAEIKARGVPVHLQIVGGPAGSTGSAYEQKLYEQVQSLDLKNEIEFMGPVAHDTISTYFKNTHLFVHASTTGSLDKALLESLAVGIPVVTSAIPSDAQGNPAIVSAGDSPAQMADAIVSAQQDLIWERDEIRTAARAYVETNHSLSALIPKIVTQLTRN